MLAISEDAPADSRAFAHDLGIEFPLLSDDAGKIASIYTGVTSDHAALPGITIVRADGSIAFRQVASSKDDRMPAAELLATIDRTLGTTGPAVAARGYAAIDRAQLRVELGGGEVRDAGDARATAVGAVAALVPIGGHVLVGPWLSFEPRDAPLDLDAAVVLRAPIWHDTGALELGFTGGWTPWRDSGWNVGARAGIWFAMSPTLSIQLGAGASIHETDTAVFATFGIARLVRVR